MSEYTRAQIEALLADATPGAWRANCREDEGHEHDYECEYAVSAPAEGEPTWVRTEVAGYVGAADAALIAAAPTIIRQLLDVWASMEADIDGMCITYRDDVGALAAENAILKAEVEKGIAAVLARSHTLSQQAAVHRTRETQLRNSEKRGAQHLANLIVLGKKLDGVRQELTARAEAAEARVAELTAQLEAK